MSRGLAFLQTLCEIIPSKPLCFAKQPQHPFLPNFQLPNILFFLNLIRISAPRPGHPEAAGQGGGKVLVAPLGLAVIPIKLDFAEVGNSSSAV